MDGDYIVGPRAARLIGPRIAGSRDYPCSECGYETVIAPTGQKRIDEGYLVLCMDCMATRLRRRDPRNN